jgi:PAS domain S-box-containing protein
MPPLNRPSPDPAVAAEDPVARILEQFDALDAELTDLLSAPTSAEAHERLLRAAARLTDAEGARLYLWDPQRREAVPGPAFGAVPPPESRSEEAQMLRWALEHKSVVQLPAEGDRSRWVIPLVGLQVRVGFLVCWCREGSPAGTVLTTDLLNAAAMRLSATMEHLTMRFETGRLRDLFDSIIECIPHAIVAVDLKERVTEMNSNAEFIFGIRRFNALDEPLEATFPPALVEAFRSLALEALKSRTSRDVEVEHRLDERTHITLGVTASTLTSREGRPEGVVFLCRDLRATRELERLRELDRMKTEFVHMVSHELKTPLTAIAGGVQLMRMNGEALTQDQQELLALIDQGSQRLQQLVQDILAIARLEAGRIQLDKEERALTRTIETVLKGLSIPPRLTIKRELMADPPKLLYDENRVRDILENLLSNAIKYSPEGGTITVGLRRDGQRLLLSVRDEGIGIPEGDLEHVFDKFHRAENAAAKGIEGTGLGLAIAKHLIELHGWDVSVASTLGRGATFTVTMPIPRPTKEPVDAD